MADVISKNARERMDTMADRKLTLVGDDDWYCIEWAEHEHRVWTEPIGPNAIALRYSGRLGNADIEGTEDEMRAIADAIETKGSAKFKRCAVRTVDEGYALCSPRNSEVESIITKEQGRQLLSEIRLILCAGPSNG